MMILQLILLLWLAWQLTRLANALTQMCDMMALDRMREDIDLSRQTSGEDCRPSQPSPPGPFGFGGPT